MDSGDTSGRENGRSPKAPPAVADRGGPARCPTCRAQRTESPTCPRCGSDLRLLLKAERLAESLYQQAIGAYAYGRFRVASRLAAQSAGLVAAPRTWRLLAAASLRCGLYPEALRAAARARAGERRGRVEG